MTISVFMIHCYLYLFNYLYSSVVPGSNPDSSFLFSESIFTLGFYQLQYLYFLMSSECVLNIIQKYFNVTFLTSICEITCVPRWFRTHDLGICCHLTPTLYHCATKNYGHVLLFVYLHLNMLCHFSILNITLCNLIILCITRVQTS